ncbi:MAG: 1-aminocyclopropane-1-carboxylate deaminase/D-cysteine desulfhydrase [Flavobacteriaceae bacterium]|nr:1-aminocyclopropane-1-carboxylate deaminase/D-cysteine desulfhydrase [Flavobacteriaceae bacterium]
MNQFIEFEGISFTVKREDLLHPVISGNKYRKMKYNVMQAIYQEKRTLLTFGGAYSNHIAAVAEAGKEFGFKTTGIIRGEELKDKIAENPTLSYAQECGMHFEFVSRQAYRKKKEAFYLDKLQRDYDDCYILPEGGTNTLAIKGCEEILTDDDRQFDTICVPVGTGGTIAGLINSAADHQKIRGFSALKGSFLIDEVKSLTTKRENWQIQTDYHFGGYGKINADLITFINQFKARTGIPLDPIYTGKMVYGIVDLFKKKYLKKEEKILVIHTGGLQGIEGINRKLKRQKRTLIER